ncbi:unnamed protein product, partial [Pylaiella littoralis]
MPTKEKKKASSSKTKPSSSSSKKDSSKDKKKKSSSSSSKRSSKSKSPSRARKRSSAPTEGERSRSTTEATSAVAAVPPHSSSHDQHDPKASLDFEAGLLFQRFARNGGVEAKDFQRMWREREKLFPGVETTPGGDGELNRNVAGLGIGGSRRASSSEGWIHPEQRRPDRGGSGSEGIGSDKIFEA